MNTRERVLEALEKARGDYVSGETLAGSCGISRNAIWKAVAGLRKNGYPIKSVPNRGYMLEQETDILSKAGIRLYLNEGTETAYRLLVYDELDSTNNEAKRNLVFGDRSILHKTVIAARRQTAGRGHGDSRFSSPDGGIYLSIILEPDKLKEPGAPVSERASSAVQSVLEELFGTVLEKKKYSSLYADGEKVCGILTEGISDLETGKYSNYIVGIGIYTEKLQSQRKDSPGKNEIAAKILKKLDF